MQTIDFLLTEEICENALVFIEKNETLLLYKSAIDTSCLLMYYSVRQKIKELFFSYILRTIPASDT